MEKKYILLCQCKIKSEDYDKLVENSNVYCFRHRKMTLYQNIIVPIKKIPKQRGVKKGFKSDVKKYIIKSHNLTTDTWEIMGEYSSLLEASKIVNISYDRLTDMYKGKRKIYNNFYKIEKIPQIPKIPTIPTIPKKIGRPKKLEKNNIDIQNNIDLKNDNVIQNNIDPQNNI